jgi:NAD(P)-dependent dehydrogenase (short-subunit alcohol dehydrogenase family)
MNSRGGKLLGGKVALVTAAGGPMGRAIAKRMASEGASLVINDISGTRLEEAVAEIEPLLQDRAHLLASRGNATLAGEAAELARAALDRFNRVDVLVNVVGGIHDKVFYRPFLEINDERWAGTFNINLNATRFLTKALGPQMLANQYGRIVNIASIDYAGDVGHADYSASKAALVSLSKVMAMEFAPHVTVNCIAPGIINTRAATAMDPDKLDELRRRNLMQRLGEPDEIAAAALFLGSDESSFITGEILSVSGGICPCL